MVSKDHVLCIPIADPYTDAKYYFFQMSMIHQNSLCIFTYLSTITESTLWNKDDLLIKRGNVQTDFLPLCIHECSIPNRGEYHQSEHSLALMSSQNRQGYKDQKDAEQCFCMSNDQLRGLDGFMKISM